MNCEKAKRWISLEMDGELSLRRAARLHAHLDRCPACFKARESWALIGEQIQKRPVPGSKSPEAAWADVRRAIRLDAGERWAKEQAWMAGAPLRWAVSALLIMILGSGLFLTLRKGPVQWARAAATDVEFVETGLPDATPMVYEDSESGWTVIWVVEANGKKGNHAGS